MLGGGRAEENRFVGGNRFHGSYKIQAKYLDLTDSAELDCSSGLRRGWGVCGGKGMGGEKRKEEEEEGVPGKGEDLERMWGRERERDQEKVRLTGGSRFQ